MTRKEALERQHQQSLQENGYATLQRSLDEGPKGTPPSARAGVVKKTITLGMVLALLWLAYRIGTTVERFAQGQGTGRRGALEVDCGVYDEQAR